MKLRCSIRNIKLPEAPPTATKTVHDDRYIGGGRHTYPARNYSTKLDGFPPSRQAYLNGHAGRMEEAKKKHAIVEQMAREGATDAEIAKETGYTTGTVRRLLTKWRSAGKDIPERRKGRKCG